MTPETVYLPEYVLDGASFDDLAGFFTAITRTLGVSSWGRNLDAFNDILRGGFGTPSTGRIHPSMDELSELSTERLGWPNDPFPRGKLTPATRQHHQRSATWPLPTGMKARPCSRSFSASSEPTARAAPNPKITSTSSWP